MVVKSDKQVRQQGILAVSVVAMFFVYLWLDTLDIVWAFLLTFPVMLIAVRGWISTDRVFVFDEEGCEASFGSYKKKYLWSDFKVKQLVNYGNALGDKNIYKKGVLLSTKNVKRPKWLKTAEYSAIVHPWCVICVEFFPEKMPDYKYAHRYAVKEEEFMEKLNEWGIELEKVG